MRYWRVGIFAAVVLAGLFSLYLFSLYREVERVFAQQEQFVPTRIYSDVARITPPQTREQVKNRLNSLGYRFEELQDTLSFTLHPVEYPVYLIPEGHPVLEDRDALITLFFEGPGVDAPLQSIQMDDMEVADVYLEPELVATLSRGSQAIRTYLRFQDIPANVWKAIIAIEDQHFLDHKGFDPRGIARALWVNLRTLSFAQGGSTLTQQLIKNLTARRGKNLFRKLNELFLALILEVRFEKEQILERYLNEVYLGQIGNLEIHGVAEGAKHFFGKNLDELNLAETAIMAGLIRGPWYYSPYRHLDRALERQRLVLKKMVETGHIAQAEADAAVDTPVHFIPPPSALNKAPYFTDFVKAELLRQLKDRISEQELTAAGFRVYTTLDMALKDSAQRALASGLEALEKRLKIPAEERLEGSLAAVDHSTGYIRALIGGRSYAQSSFNRILNMKRQVGSTFKPFVYLTALAKGKDAQGISYGSGYPIEDAPWKLIYDQGRQKWAPRNYEKKHMGWISFRTALAHSVNTAAAKLGVEMGIDSVIETTRALGVDSPLPEVPSLSLGVAELSPVELLRAYATLANHGVQDELTVIRGITYEDGSAYARFVYHPKQVFPSGPIDLLSDMLQSVFTEGTARAAADMGFHHPAAGKTGTTSHYRDAWFAGYTPQLTSVVWVGLDQDKRKPDQKARILLTGAGSALPIWTAFMKEAHRGEPPMPFPLSPHLVTVRVDRHTGKLALSDCPESLTLTEKYVIGNEPQSSSCESLPPATVGESVME